MHGQAFSAIADTSRGARFSPYCVRIDVVGNLTKLRLVESSEPSGYRRWRSQRFAPHIDVDSLALRHQTQRDFWYLLLTRRVRLRLTISLSIRLRVNILPFDTLTG